jgi:hypothetical protein
VYTDLSPSLPEFLKHLQSTPTTGQKDLSWETLEGERRFDATLDALGHIFIVYRLRSPDIGSSKCWSFTGPLVLELGNLPEVSKRLDRFWGAAT